MISLRERDAIDASLVVQTVGFILYVLSLFGIQVQMPLYLDVALRITGLFLVYSLLSEFLEDELKTSVNLLPLLIIMLLTQINPVLRSYFSIEILAKYSVILNDIVLISIFVLLPAYLYISGVRFREGIKLFLFTIIVAYPVAQLYDFFVSGIISFLSILYLFYALITALPRSLSLWEVLKRTIQFDDFFVGMFLDIASKMDRKFFLAYSLLLFYFSADLLLYIIPPLTGHWGQDWYMHMLGLSYPLVSDKTRALIIVLAFLVVVFYPLLPDRIGKRNITMLLVSPLAALFLTSPIINVETFINPNAYGVILNLEKANVNVHLLVETTIFLWLFLFLIEPSAGDGVIKLLSVSFMLRYTTGYALSTFIHIWVWYRDELLYALLAGILGISYVALGLYTTGRVVGEILANLDTSRLMLLPIGAIFFPLVAGNVYSLIFSAILIEIPLLTSLTGFQRFRLSSYLGFWIMSTYSISVIKFPGDLIVLTLIALASVLYAWINLPLRTSSLKSDLNWVHVVILMLVSLTCIYLLRGNTTQFFPAILIGGAFAENLVLKPMLFPNMTNGTIVIWSLMLTMIYSTVLRVSLIAGLFFLTYSLIEGVCFKKCSWEIPFLFRFILGILTLV